MKVQPASAPEPARSKKWLIVALLVAAVAAGAWYYLRPQPQKQQAAAATMRIAKVTSGSLDAVIRVSGTTSARNFANIVAPMLRGPESGRALVLMSLVKSGARVKKGDTVAQIDAQAATDHAEDVQAMVYQANLDIGKRKAEQEIELETQRQIMRSVKAQFDKATLDFKAKEIRTPVDQELIKLAMDEAEANYKLQQSNMPIILQRHKSQVRLLELTRDRQVRHYDRHATDIKRFTMKAPIDGLVVMQSIWRGGDMGQIQEGDQIAPGQLFMKVVDTSNMQIEGQVNQSESEAVRLGQPAGIEVDAFPGLRLPGKIHSINSLAVSGARSSGYWLRTVPVKVTIMGHDPRLIPDLSASADVVLERKENATLVPLEAVKEQNGKTVVYVKSAQGWEPKSVELGLRSNTQAEVLSGLTAGQEVAITLPAQPAG